ncbi:MAG: UDP-4-amino-4,6-dideoxy-N-acetyl-beta-L-altrosamine transaminase [bacterium]|nr:UDP-4-amino-4,6-dideoxy-N-acetyl-beta-L-altrosamine transaminase [bacterium]
MANDKIISYGKQWIFDEDFHSIEEVLKSPFLTTGPKAHEFENALCELTGAKHAVVCSNGTAALHLACLALGISEGDIGLTSPNTFLSSANCVEFCGGSVDFIDIDPETLCLSPELLDEYCQNNKAPKVVIPVDFGGTPANLPKIKSIADKYGFFIIEDAAHSIGSSYTYEGVEYQCGSCAHTDLAIFSFHPVKTITTGEGGAVLTNNAELAKKVRSLCSHGMVRNLDINESKDGPWYYEMEKIGYNYRLTDFQSALGNAQLKHLGDFKKRRIEIANRYSQAFNNIKSINNPILPEDNSICPHLYVIQFSEGSKKRHEVYKALRESNIFCQIHYIPVYWQPYYEKKYGYKKGKCPNAESYYERCLSIPLYPSLSNEDVDFVIEKIMNQL